MSEKAAITVLRSREEVERLWESSEHRPQDVTTTYKDAPGDRGTEIHLELAEQGRMAGLAEKVGAVPALAKAKDALRRFKAEVETGEIARSDGTPEGELAERKFKQRPAQPLEDDELEKASV
jgi:hypothetical protein